MELTKLSELTKFTIGKGGNFSLPRKPYVFIRGRTIRIIFCPTKDGIYNIPNDEILKDQNDFNKGGGLIFSSFKPRENSALLGWRWNTEKNKFQYVSYFNVNWKNIYNESEDNIINADPDDVIWMDLKTGKKEIQSTLYVNGVKQNSVIQHYPNGVNLILHGSQPWFGGNTRAPNDIIVYGKHNRL